MENQNQSEQQNTTNPLEDIKNEITAGLNDKDKKPIAWNSIIVTAVLSVLTIMSLGQMAASAKIFKKLQDVGVSGANASTGAPQNNSLESQPDMVGGC